MASEHLKITLSKERQWVSREKTSSRVELSLYLLMLVKTVWCLDMIPDPFQQRIGTNTINSMPVYCRYPNLFNPGLGQPGEGIIFGRWTQPGTTATSYWMFSGDRIGRRIGMFDGSGYFYVRQSVLTIPKRMFSFATGGTTTAQEHTLSYDSSSGLYTQITWTTNSAFLNPRGFFYEAGTTNYLYYSHDLGATALIRKWDIIARVGLAQTAPSIPALIFSPTIYGQTFLVYTQSFTDMLFVDRASMTVAKTLTGSVTPKQFTVDNLNNSVLFVCSNVSPYGFVKSVLLATVYAKTASVGNVNIEYSNILNFGPYQYIGLVRWDTTPRAFRMYNKADIIEVSTNLFTPIELPAYTDETLVQGPSEGNKFFLYYASTGSSVYNFQSYYIQFDLCSSRPGGAGAANAICPSCPAGYYLNTVGIANNECYPEGWGLNKDTSALVPCADSVCRACSQSDKCTNCSISSNRSLILDFQCVDLSYVKLGRGITPNRQIVPCADSNCVNCTNNYQICTECDQANGLTLSGTVCVEDTIRTIYVVNTRFDPRQLIAAVEFNTNIKIDRSNL